MFALISVRVCLAFVLLDQMFFQEFKAISIKANFNRTMFKLLETPKHTHIPMQPRCCANDTLESEAEYSTPNTALCQFNGKSFLTNK